MGMEELIIYRRIASDGVWRNFEELRRAAARRDCDRGELLRLSGKFFGSLLEFASRCGLAGNLWHQFVAYSLAGQENAYSRACERRGDAGGSLSRIARHDFEILMEMFRFDFHAPQAGISLPCADEIAEFSGEQPGGCALSPRMRERIEELSASLKRAGDAEAFQAAVADFYREYGVGELGMHKAFRIQDAMSEERGRRAPARIVPIPNIARVSFDDLSGYELAKEKLIANTEAFVSGRKANNCLLYGDAGTGKSSSVKAVASRYYERGLRLIELYRHQFRDLHDVISQVKNRNYKFILYLDDLSFEDFETEYKYLKAVIEGGLEEKPDNILIYATSNRRHLVREKFSDKREILDDLHGNDTVQEKLSLSARFGLQIYFGAPDKREFEEIVKLLARRGSLSMDEDELLARANMWELSHGGRSGRTARQFIDDLLGKEER